MVIKSHIEPTPSADDLHRTYIPHLRTQFSHAQPILLTGAGFSVAARNMSGTTLPTYHEIQAKLWELCFPGVEFEEGSTLPYLFDHARMRHKNKLATELLKLLSVDSHTLPPWYQQIFSFPWFRCYTLNVDDLASAANRAFDLPRQIRAVSATNPHATTTGSNSSEFCEVIHLNGTISDIPDNVTFSVMQFAERISKVDPWYTRFVADLLSRPIVIIGTRLDEPPLWQHLAYRGVRGNKQLGELRPRSYLVTPHLDRVRKALLTEFNIFWLQMTAEQFTTEVLSQLSDARTQGLQSLKIYSPDRNCSVGIPDVTDLAVNPTEDTIFLLGNEPIWADVQSGRAIRRDSDDQLWTGIKSSLQENLSNLIVVTGTAGSGKSTALMRACLTLMAQGERVGWVDRYSDLSPRDIHRSITSDDAPRILAIDDADTYGSSLASSVRDWVVARDNILVLVALRSSKLDRTLNPAVIGDIAKQEFSMSPLTDSDIDSLLTVLDEHNRLGMLKGKSLPERRRILAQQCGRQLLVAMIEATSGRKFEEKAIQELTDLEGEQARIYAIVAVAHALGFPLQRDEILIALVNPSNETLNIVRRLLDRHIIVSHRNRPYLQARHRVIAEVLHNELQKHGQIASVLSRLAFVAASKVSPDVRRTARPWRMLKKIINHDYLLKSVGQEQASNIYGELESILKWDFHYWLQRGSLEVEEGNLKFARQFLSQARSIASDDHFVETEWAYLLFREAIDNPGATYAQEYANEAETILEDLINRYVFLDSYPYHVLGSQGLAWSRRGIKNSMQKRHYLYKLLGIVEAGIKKHPGEQELQPLRDAIRREYLNLAVTKR